MSMLQVSDLTVAYQTRNGVVSAVNDVSFEVGEGEFFGLIGESGSGKSTVAKAVARLLPPNGQVLSGQVQYRAEDVLYLDEKHFRKLRWNEIATVPQSAMNSLDPVYTIGAQMVEAIQAHQKVKKQDALLRAAEMLKIVGIDVDRLDAYPHQFSGGMKQRAIIAMSLVLDPSLIIADEPTTGLDVIVQDQIFVQFSKIVEELRKSVLLITHDVSIVAENCDRVAVMYGGRIMEYGAAANLFNRPFHPYTMGLQNAFPSLRGPKKTLISIPGYPPNLMNPPPGCPFARRCPFATQLCSEELPPLLEVEAGHFSLCHYPEKVDEFRALAKSPKTWQRTD